MGAIAVVSFVVLFGIYLRSNRERLGEYFNEKEGGR